MILKHRDTEVLRFDWTDSLGVHNVETNPSAERFLPLAIRDRVRRQPECLRFDLEEWLRTRTPPTSRRGIRDMLRHLGFYTDDPSVASIRFADVFFHWLDIPGGVTDEMIDRLKGLGKFEFRPHPQFVMPDERLEVSQYFLQNRIAKIIRYREKTDRFLSIRRKDVIINPTISDKMLKRSQEADDLRKELRATLKSFPRAKTEKLAILFKTTTRTIARHLKAMQDAGELKRVGSRKTGYWQVIEKGNEE